MTISFYNGDLFAFPNCKAFMHGCNTQGVMGKGIALEFKKRWPVMYKNYRKQCLANTFQGGDVYEWVENGVYVFNAMTQLRTGAAAQYSFIESSMEKVALRCLELSIPQIATPRIGAGIGGLDWDKVKPILKRIFTKKNVDLLVIENFLAGEIPVLQSISG
jgi:O-acetyl-ADP-ribose deacetylase (regulator of RNase III)